MVQDFIRDVFGKPFSWMADQIGKVHWRQKYPISAEAKATIMEMLKTDYYVIATRRGNHLSTYAISLGHFFLTGRFGYYSHVLMNMEDEVKSPDDFRLVEAVGVGSRWSTWEDVFGDDSGKNAPDSVALLKPRAMSTEEWTQLLDKAKSMVGKQYDTLFDLADDTKVSCVELVRNVLSAEPGYDVDFAEFERMIAKRKNLTPQMFRSCSDFEVVYEVRR